MGRPKKASAVLQTAEDRLFGMKLIDPKLDVGGGCNTANIESKARIVRKKLDEYNALRCNLDTVASELERAEKALNHLSKKVLTGVATIYDKESDEYEKVGGIKPSDRKRAKQRPSAVTV